jgi:hypothetical protein
MESLGDQLHDLTAQDKWWIVDIQASTPETAISGCPVPAFFQEFRMCLITAPKLHVQFRNRTVVMG